MLKSIWNKINDKRNASEVTFLFLSSHKLFCFKTVLPFKLTLKNKPILTSIDWSRKCDNQPRCLRAVGQMCCSEADGGVCGPDVGYKPSQLDGVQDKTQRKRTGRGSRTTCCKTAKISHLQFNRKQASAVSPTITCFTETFPTATQLNIRTVFPQATHVYFQH